jgi:hypothetical protein
MMGDVVNLRRARKHRAREAAQAEAQANRLQFGRPAAERKLEEAREELEARRLDAHKRSE